MLNHYILDHWLVKLSVMSDKVLLQSQIGQAYARLAFACGSLLYIYLHGSQTFNAYQGVFLWVTAAYLCLTLVSIPSIHRQPLSVTRMLIFPLFDTFVVTFAMLIDGGLSSGIYFILLIIIFGNSFRFGNAMLRYSQASSLISIISLAIFIDIYAPETLDITLLGWQISALLVMPFYIHLVNQKVEKALKRQVEAEESSFLLMDKGPLPIFNFELNKDKIPVITYANTSMHKLFQYDAEQLISSNVDIITLSDDNSELISFCRSVYEQDYNEPGHTAKNIYIRGQNQSGDILKLMCTAISMRWRSKWIGVCFIHDITQRETTQEELESMHRNTYMSTLVAGIVHDFRNVLTNMIGYAEVMQFSCSNPSEQQQLESIIEAGDRGSELTTHLLNLSKNSRMEVKSNFTEGPALTKPLENIIGIARLQLPPHIQLLCKLGLPLHDVNISMTEIEQILLNLINNSTQAIADRGQIEVHIRNDPNHQLSKPDHPSLCIQVSDNGAGIASENIDIIFKPFWTSRSHEGGSGLGLTMVQRIVKRNKGKVMVQSTPNQQTTFTIHLPPYIASLEPLDNISKLLIPSSQETQKDINLSGYHALLVDDAPDILHIHQAMLAHMNITSETAPDGKIALDLFLQKKKHFDFIITDYKMPVMDGLTLVTNIRAKDTKCPILMISAYGEDDQLQQVLKNNVNLLNKPINMDKLKAAIIDTLFANKA